MMKISTRFALLALALGLTISAWAKPKSENITLYHEATINGTSLPAGDYLVKYESEGSNTKVTFFRNGKEVASATGELKMLPKKTQASQVVVNTEGGMQSISEIDFGGKDTAISFAQGATAVGK